MCPNFCGSYWTTKHMSVTTTGVPQSLGILQSLAFYFGKLWHVLTPDKYIGFKYSALIPMDIAMLLHGIKSMFVLDKQHSFIEKKTLIFYYSLNSKAVIIHHPIWMWTERGMQICISIFSAHSGFRRAQEARICHCTFIAFYVFRSFDLVC